MTSEDADGDPIDGEHRLRAYRAAQCFFAARQAILLFDETEDVFNDGDGPLFFRVRSTSQKRNAWMNRALEGNPVPTLWLTNAVGCLDPAFVRRFDQVIELDVPPLAARERIITEAGGDLVAPSDRTRMASADALAPAVVARATAVVRSIRDRLPPAHVSSAVCALVDATLLAQGHSRLPLANAALPKHYDPRFVNVDADLQAIADGLTQSRTGRLCLYGPPGTGKSAFGRWLADRLQMPLHLKRVSDIVSPWVGMTERNLARAFRDAEAEGAVLLLDEVDSFLQERRGAQRSWEVTEVNEMLTQMESFGGVFIATTNLMEGLDAAALRRFDIKLCFGFLAPAQAVELLAANCATLGLAEPTAADRAALAAAQSVTPGDFAAAARQHRFRPLSDAAALVRAVLAECALKKDAPRRAIGFG